MKLAIVGTGISGLVAARVLAREHDVSVFEAASYVGGHTNTVDVELRGRSYAVDTGFIVFNERTYPGFCRLLEQLGVRSRDTDMSFSVRCKASGLEYGGGSLNAIFAQRRNLLRPAFLGMLREVLRFHREAPALLSEPNEKLTLGDWLLGAGYGDAFVEQHLIPLGASIWSSTAQSFRQFPAQAVVRFLGNHGLLGLQDHLQWRVIEGGSREYVRPLIATLADRIRLRTPVHAITRSSGHVIVTTRAGHSERFDRVVLATHSDQALALLTDPSPAERGILGSLRYQRNDAVLHTDERLLPRSRRARASWNYQIPEESGQRVLVTYDMNRLQGLDSPERLLVTLNGSDHIDPSRVLRRFEYDHPVFTPDGIAAQRLHARIDGVRRTHFCGAYWGNGFHEDGVQSALAVTRRFGLDLDS